mmetsp:Transcript_31107/g.72232  ORF Transcript_31107/g.72232 Transcript_31107/m.72232 type:complete len:179 (+) Transcript_31107:195-731(+)
MVQGTLEAILIEHTRGGGGRACPKRKPRLEYEPVEEDPMPEEPFLLVPPTRTGSDRGRYMQGEVREEPVPGEPEQGPVPGEPSELFPQTPTGSDHGSYMQGEVRQEPVPGEPSVVRPPALTASNDCYVQAPDEEGPVQGEPSVLFPPTPTASDHGHDMQGQVRQEPVSGRAQRSIRQP